MFKKFIFLVSVLLASSFSVLAFGQNPYAQSNNSWITLNGTIEEVSRDSFKLDYGPGSVTVEMDDNDRDADGYKLLKGDMVTVSGKIDRDVFEKTKIEAGSVFVANIGTTFYANPADEEDVSFYQSFTPFHTLPLGSTQLHGKVTDVKDRNLTLDTGYAKFTVDTKKMSFNPLDKEGYLQVVPGDRITVSGKMKKPFFEARTFEADGLVAFSDRTKNKSVSH
jgi:hypothetical protein